MKGQLAFSLFTVVLYGIWLLLNDSLAPGQLLLGFVITTMVLLATAAMVRSRARPHHLMIAIRLFFVVLIDICRSNIAVARIILGSKERQQNSGFMRIPIDMRDQYGLAVLACIITSTPGTIWAGLSPEGVLTIHVLDLQEEEIWINIIKNHYEAPLMKIFE